MVELSFSVSTIHFGYDMWSVDDTLQPWDKVIVDWDKRITYASIVMKDLTEREPLRQGRAGKILLCGVRGGSSGGQGRTKKEAGCGLIQSHCDDFVCCWSIE